MSRSSSVRATCTDPEFDDAPSSRYLAHQIDSHDPRTVRLLVQRSFRMLHEAQALLASGTQFKDLVDQHQRGRQLRSHHRSSPSQPSQPAPAPPPSRAPKRKERHSPAGQAERRTGASKPAKQSRQQQKSNETGGPTTAPDVAASAAPNGAAPGADPKPSPPPGPSRKPRGRPAKKLPKDQAQGAPPPQQQPPADEQLPTAAEAPPALPSLDGASLQATADRSAAIPPAVHPPCSLPSLPAGEVTNAWAGNPIMERSEGQHDPVAHSSRPSRSTRSRSVPVAAEQPEDDVVLRLQHMAGGGLEEGTPLPLLEEPVPAPAEQQQQQLQEPNLAAGPLPSGAGAAAEPLGGKEELEARARSAADSVGNNPPPSPRARSRQANSKQQQLPPAAVSRSAHTPMSPPDMSGPAEGQDGETPTGDAALDAAEAQAARFPFPSRSRHIAADREFHTADAGEDEQVADGGSLAQADPTAAQQLALGEAALPPVHASSVDLQLAAEPLPHELQIGAAAADEPAEILGSGGISDTEMDLDVGGSLMANIVAAQASREQSPPPRRRGGRGGLRAAAAKRGRAPRGGTTAARGRAKGGGDGASPVAAPADPLLLRRGGRARKPRFSATLHEDALGLASSDVATDDDDNAADDPAPGAGPAAAKRARGGMPLRQSQPGAAAAGNPVDPIRQPEGNPGWAQAGGAGPSGLANGAGWGPAGGHAGANVGGPAAGAGRGREELEAVQGALGELVGWLESGRLLEAQFEALEAGFWDAQGRARFNLPGVTKKLDTIAQLKGWMATEADWSRGAVKVACPDYQRFARDKLQAILGDSAGSLGVVGVQRLPHGAAQILGSWVDSEVELSAAAFRETALRVSAAIFKLWADAAQRLKCEPADNQAFACFVEAVLPLAPPGYLRPLYAPMFDISTVRHAGATAATAFDVPLPHTDPEADEEVEGTLEDFDNCCAWCGTALSQADAGLGGACRRAMSGISQAVGIFSMLATAALLHVEDMGFGSWNMLLYGAPKIWYVVAPEKEAAFLTELAAMHPDVPILTASFVKQLLPRLRADQMERLGVTRIVQLPGEAVLTRPGLVFHWTISAGYSFAESVNYFVPVGGYSLADACADFNAHQAAIMRAADEVAPEWNVLRMKAQDRKTDTTAVLYSVLRDGVPGLAQAVAAATRRK